MGSIHWPSNPGSRSTKATAFIQCVDCWEPQTHELWCLDLDNIIRKFHPTVLIDFIAGTVGEFMADYLSENGCKIQIIRQLSVNSSIQCLSVPDHGRGSGLPFICSLQAFFVATGCVSANNSNQNWVGIIFNTYSMINIDRGTSVDPRLVYLLRSPFNPHAAQFRVCKNLLCRSCQYLLWRH